MYVVGIDGSFSNAGMTVMNYDENSNTIIGIDFYNIKGGLFKHEVKGKIKADKGFTSHYLASKLSANAILSIIKATIKDEKCSVVIEYPVLGGNWAVGLAMLDVTIATYLELIGLKPYFITPRAKATLFNIKGKEKSRVREVGEKIINNFIEKHSLVLYNQITITNMNLHKQTVKRLEKHSSSKYLVTDDIAESLFMALAVIKNEFDVELYPLHNFRKTLFK